MSIKMLFFNRNERSSVNRPWARCYSSRTITPSLPKFSSINAWTRGAYPKYEHILLWVQCYHHWYCIQKFNPPRQLKPVFQFNILFVYFKSDSTAPAAWTSSRKSNSRRNSTVSTSLYNSYGKIMHFLNCEEWFIRIIYTLFIVIHLVGIKKYFSTNLYKTQTWIRICQG